MNNSYIKRRQIACYNDFVKSFFDTINNYPPINNFQAITDEFATSLENDFPDSYIFQHYFSAKAKLLEYATSEDINKTRANRIIAFCDQLCSLFLKFIDPDEINCMPLIGEFGIILGRLQSDLSLLTTQYYNNSKDTRSNSGPELD